MAELTVAIRAHNAAPYITGAVTSVLEQSDIDCSVIVIDDGSHDGTREKVQLLADSRVQLIHNKRQQGAGRCFNLALDRNRSQFFATFEGTGVVLPGGLRKLVDACRASPKVGMAHSRHFEIDANGKSTRDQFRAQRSLFQEWFAAETNYTEFLLRHDHAAGYLRIYPAQVFETTGRFSEHSLVDTNYDMALRVAQRFQVNVLPEYLYCHRVLDRNVRESRLRAIVCWRRKALHWRKLQKAHTVSLPNDHARKILTASLRDAIGFANVRKRFVDRLLSVFWRLYSFLETNLYDGLIDRFASKPVYLAPNGHVRTSAKPRRIAYYTWHFPVLSQTFINRELAALKLSGVAVEVIADEPEDVALADDNAKLLLDHTHYLEPIDRNRLRHFHRYFFRKDPLAYVRSFMFVVSRRYGSYKTIHEDMAVFSQAVYLSGTLLDREIDHIHSPWSDRCAFVAMLAAQLAGITYSVQARAHDIHRNGYLFALAEKFEPARFIVTNTRYNETYMQTFLNRAHWPRLTVIHNGLDLERFQPRPKTNTQGKIRIVCVARLIEQKGLIYLLKACAALRDQGFAFDCEIVGGTEDIFMNYYLECKRLRRQLELEEVVRLSGTLPFKAVLERYARADILVLPCVIAADGSRDITPNALIEAMAMKLAVVSTTVTGVPEIVENGVSGILVQPNDEAALTQAIANLIADPALRHRLGEQARKRVEDKFDINKNIAQYVRLFGDMATAPDLILPHSYLFRDQGPRRSSTTVGHS